MSYGHINGQPLKTPFLNVNTKYSLLSNLTKHNCFSPLKKTMDWPKQKRFRKITPIFLDHSHRSSEQRLPESGRSLRKLLHGVAAQLSV